MKMHSALSLFVGLLLLFSLSNAQAATITCASIGEILFVDGLQPQEVRADVPAGATFVSATVYTRWRFQGQPWQQCTSTNGVCADMIQLGNFRTIVDQADNATSYVLTVWPYSTNRFTKLSATRLWVVYTTPQASCLSQATYDVLPGSSDEFRLIVPPSIPTAGYQDWVRAVEAPLTWKKCDDQTSNPQLFNACKADYVFGFYYDRDPFGDEIDGALGRIVRCSAKPENNWVNKQRRCRAALVYSPGAKPLILVPDDFKESMPK